MMNSALYNSPRKSDDFFQPSVCVNSTWSLLLILAVTSFPLLFQNQAFADGADAEPQLYGTLVIGKRPGPPLWKVTNQDNVLWIFGTLDYLPKRLKWDPASVRFELSNSKEYISPPQISARENNPFKAISLMRKFLKAEKIPDGKTLQDVLSEQLYERFLEAKSIYAPRDNKILKLRPLNAASSLFRAAQASVGLSLDQKVGKKLRSIARGRGATLIDHRKSLDVDTFLLAYENIFLEDEIACLQSTLQTIDTDLEAMIIRANAWADGDAELLLKLDYPDRQKVCLESLLSTNELRRVFEQTRIEWVESIESALTNNKISFANFPMREIVQPEGLLAQLRQQGYVISGQETMPN